MILLSNSIPSNIPDSSNPKEMIDFLIAVKLCIEELALKAKSIQMETRSSSPNTYDLEEKEDADYVSGGVVRRYTKIDGTIRYNVQT